MLGGIAVVVGRAKSWDSFWSRQFHGTQVLVSGEFLGPMELEKNLSDHII